MKDYQINDRVRLTKVIIEYPYGDKPGGICGNKGDVVVIRRIIDFAEWPYSVSHEDRTDGNTYSVGENEISKIKELP